MRCLLIILFCLSSCTQPTYKPSTKQQLANEIRCSAAISIKEKTGLVPSGTAGQMLHEIKMLGLAFDCYREIDIDEGRRLAIVAISELLDITNLNSEIRPYLFNYPFLQKNVEIEIYIHRKDGSQFPPGNLCVVTVVDGILKYKIKEQGSTQSKVILQETYEEAILKLEQETKKGSNA